MLITFPFYILNPIYFNSVNIKQLIHFIIVKFGSILGWIVYFRELVIIEIVLFTQNKIDVSS